MKEERISSYRVAAIIGMIISVILSCIFLCYINKLEKEQIISVIFTAIAFFPIIIFELIYERRRELIGNNAQTTYKRALDGFLFCCLIMVGISFMPAYFKLVLIIPVVMSAYSNDTLGLITGIYFNVILAFTTGSNFYELLVYTMLVLVGGMLSKMLKHIEYRLFIAIIYFFSSVLFPNLCCYFIDKDIQLNHLLFGMLNGFIVAIYVIVFYPITRERTIREKHYYYGDIMSDDFPQVKTIKKSFPSEYDHAKKVSDLAYKYALQLDLNADLAAAAGFYYHLGKWEGDPPIENAVKKANQLCFPNELIQILKEYNATDDLPSTPESALVHIIDGLLTKLEMSETEIRTSQWNKDVLIHQTLNDFSSAGYYDNSGLSINSFIKIRDWLAKEELLQ